MINPLFAKAFNEGTFASFIEGFIPDIVISKKRAEPRYGFKSIQQIAEATGSDLDLVVFIAKPDSSLNARVEITKSTYAVLKNHARSNALIAYISDDSLEWRFSLITTKVARTKEGVRETISNPHRFSYLLGPSAKVLTPSMALFGVITTIKDLESKFSLAVVSKEFYTRIAVQYSSLVGGTRGEGSHAKTYERTLKLGTSDDTVNANFAIRLIGRLVFCWFLKQKKGIKHVPLIPEELLSVSVISQTADYYHSICAPLFFEVLNKPMNSRPAFFTHSELFNKVPFLDGGLFQDHAEDNHKFNRTSGLSEHRGVVVVPDVWFAELFGIFEEYNFTIDENTSIDTELSIDPEMLGRIFENLLAEVNPETGASARKATGSFYTPREIVDFMVEESLVAHLKTETGISDEKLRSLSSYDLEDDTRYSFTKDERKILVDAIHNTAVLDPACGSGAFPIGMLQHMVHILGVLDPDCSIYLNKFPAEERRQLMQHNPTYVRKLGVIRECIHGVDIQPIAVDISRLRCFLTLVVDQQVDDNAPNRGIEPLPNLDFKFVCANTLIKPPVHENPLFGDEFAKDLGELIDEYFRPVDSEQKLIIENKLRKLISGKTKKEFENIINDTGLSADPKWIKQYKNQKNKIYGDRQHLINLWDSYQNIFENKPVGFFDTRYFFPTVHKKGGFDIVIGNPPYVNIFNIKDKIYREYVKKKYSVYKNKTDLYAFFIERGFDLLKKSGVLYFIISNSWLGTDSFVKLREFLVSKTKVIALVNCYPDVFEASVTTVILGLKKEKTSTHEINLSKFDGEFKSITHKLTYDQIKNQPSLGFTFEIPLLFKIDTKSLGSICNFSLGVKTSNDKRFISDQKLNDEYWPVLRGKDTDSYSVTFNNKYLWYRPDLMMEKTGAGPRKKEVFIDNKKILVKDVAQNISATIDPDGYFTTDTLNIIYNPKENYSLEFILGLINSNFVRKWFKISFPAGLHIKLNQLKLVPIPTITSGNKIIVQKVEDLVNQILTLKKQNKDADTKNLEAQIDQLVYKLYDLGSKEIEIVENSSKK